MDAKLIAQGIIDGIASIPESLYLSVVRTIDGSGIIERNYKMRNDYETERFFRMVKSMIANEEPVRKLITIVITDFYGKLDENGKKAFNDKLGYADAKLGGRVGAQAFISQAIATRIITRLRTGKLMSRLVRIGSGLTFSVIMLQGLIEEAARASRRMKQKYSSTYFKVSPMNLDMAYFLVENELEPYLMFIHSHPVQCKGIENEICKIISR